MALRSKAAYSERKGSKSTFILTLNRPGYLPIQGKENRLFHSPIASVIGTGGLNFLIANALLILCHSLFEVVVDTFVELYEKKAVLKHNGRISSLPSDKLREFINENSELITVEGNTLYIGWLPNDRLLFLDREEERQCMYALIEYALLRDKYRNFMRNL